MYVILQLQHSVGDVSNSTSSTVQSLTELVLFFWLEENRCVVLVGQMIWDFSVDVFTLD